MMYNSNKNLTLVVYEDQRPTKCFELKKTHIKFVLILLSLIFFATILTSMFVLSYIRNVTVALKDQGPIIYKKFQNEQQKLIQGQQELQSTHKELEEINKSLLAKLRTNRAPELLVPLIAPPMGSRDLTREQLISFENFNVKQQGDKLVANFNLINPHTNKKISGHIFVVLKAGSSFSIYPAHSLGGKNSFLANFDGGEPFSVSHLRPVVAQLNYRSTDRAPTHLLSFELIAFSREGDLILKKTVGPMTLANN